jgi:hypothetical protein
MVGQAQSSEVKTNSTQLCNLKYIFNGLGFDYILAQVYK